jgi:hypothetical protein
MSSSSDEFRDIDLTRPRTAVMWRFIKTAKHSFWPAKVLWIKTLSSSVENDVIEIHLVSDKEELQTRIFVGAKNIARHCVPAFERNLLHNLRAALDCIDGARTASAGDKPA